MTTGSNQCSMRNNDAKNNCTGCQQFCCVIDYTKHRAELSMDFDSDVVINDDELLQLIHKTPNYSADDLFSQIDQWEKTTINKIHKVAQNVREKLNDLINFERETFTKQFESLTTEVRHRREEEDFDENNIEQLQQSVQQLNQPNKNNLIVAKNDQINSAEIIDSQTATRQPLPNDKWNYNATTVAGGHSHGNGLNQLYYSCGVYVDDDQTIYVADRKNHRIVEWQCGATSGKVLAGGNVQGNRNDQLSYPEDVIVDKHTDSLIISDQDNRRVVRWPRRDGTSGETIISNVESFGLTMDNEGFLYVSDHEKHEVRRWKIGETQGTLVAGGNGQGQRLDQLYRPTFVFVDRDHSVYVSDLGNQRVMKWAKDAKEGVVVAGGQGQGNALTQLSYPRGLIVDRLGTVYVADELNHRVMRWYKGATQGSIVIGENGQGGQANQLNYPVGLSFDLDGNLYVADNGNHRVQKFSIAEH